MWEFSIIASSQNVEMSRFIYQQLKPRVQDVKGVMTCYEKLDTIKILLACPKHESVRIKYFVADVLSEAISTFTKEEFLQKSLKFPQKTPLEIETFRSALVCFDRETDRYLINKCQDLSGESVVIESFFHFKLQALKEKWNELIKIANDNTTYLLNGDSFIELLRFLIENIEIGCDEVNVVCQDGKYHVLSQDFEKISQIEDECCDEINLVRKLLKLSPRKINWYSQEHHEFLERVFSKRIYFIRSEEKFKNILDKRMKMV